MQTSISEPSKNPSPLEREFSDACAKVPRGKLTEAGLGPDAVSVCGGVGMMQAQLRHTAQRAGRTFAPAAYGAPGQQVVLVGAYDLDGNGNSRLVDVISWRLGDPGSWYCRTGDGVALGAHWSVPRARSSGKSLTLWQRPADYPANCLDGAVLLRLEDGVKRLAGIAELRCMGSPAFAELIASTMRDVKMPLPVIRAVPVPKVELPEPSRMISGAPRLAKSRWL